MPRTNGRSTDNSSFSSELRAPTALQYKLDAYCNAHWMCIAVFLLRGGGGWVVRHSSEFRVSDGCLLPISRASPATVHPLCCIICTLLTYARKTQMKCQLPGVLKQESASQLSGERRRHSEAKTIYLSEVSCCLKVVVRTEPKSPQQQTQQRTCQWLGTQQTRVAHSGPQGPHSSSCSQSRL